MTSIHWPVVVEILQTSEWAPELQSGFRSSVRRIAMSWQALVYAFTTAQSIDGPSSAGQSQNILLIDFYQDTE